MGPGSIAAGGVGYGLWVPPASTARTSLPDRYRVGRHIANGGMAGVPSHPYVVTIYDVGENDGGAFMVMARMRGGTDAARRKAGRAIADETALRWLREAAGALDAAHEAGVVHRDIKPGNLLLDDHDRLAIADF